MATARLHIAFCEDIRRRPDEGVALPFGDNANGISCRQVAYSQFFIPHTLKRLVRHIHRYARLAGHPRRRNLSQSLRKDLLWHALAVEFYVNVRHCIAC